MIHTLKYSAAATLCNIEVRSLPWESQQSSSKITDFIIAPLPQ